MISNLEHSDFTTISAVDPKQVVIEKNLQEDVNEQKILNRLSELEKVVQQINETQNMIFAPSPNRKKDSENSPLDRSSNIQDL